MFLGQRIGIKWLLSDTAFFFFLQDTLEYKKKQRPLKIRMLDGTVKTVMVDDSKIVTDLLMTICARIGKPSGIHFKKKKKKPGLVCPLTSTFKCGICCFICI